MPSPSFGSRIRAIRNHLGKTQREFGELIGVSRQQVLRWESGERGMTQKRLAEICETLGITQDQFWDPDWPNEQENNGGEMLRGEVEGPYRLSGEVLYLPVVAEVQAGKPREVIEREGDYMRINVEFVPPGASEDDLIFVRVQGDSMVDVGLHEGDLVLVHLQSTVENGQVAVVDIEDEGACIKKVYFAGDHVFLYSENSNYPPRHLPKSQVRIVGRVRRALKEF